ncbi:hypothetical protein GJAV_G00264060 [Gymnothorax javanicus]|nr:hypothetical protein GJAV_G00264060 [Gymnothorax javanicus]
MMRLATHRIGRWLGCKDGFCNLTCSLLLWARHFGLHRRRGDFWSKMKGLEEPPYLTVGTDVSAKYRGAFCEAKIKTAKRLVKAKVSFKQDSSTGEVHDEHIRGPLKVGATVEVRKQDGMYHEATINKLTDASLYTVVFDDGDEKTLRRSSLCLKGARHFAESETLDQLPLTNPEHFGTPVIGKKGNRGRRSNPVQEEDSSSSSSEEEEGDQRLNDELLGKVVCVDCVSVGDQKKTPWYPAMVISPDCRDESQMKKDSVLVRSFQDGRIYTVQRKDIRELDTDATLKPDTELKPAVDSALDFLRSGAVPDVWRTELKEDSSSGEEEDDGEEEEQEEGGSSEEEEEEEVEPFPEERENFLQQLYKFMEDRGTPINKRPVLGYRNLNLFKLYRLVNKLGGFDNIDSGSVWKQVYQDLGIPVLNSAAGYNVKCAYRKYLYGFEEYCTSAGIHFRMDLPQKLVEKQGPKPENQGETEPGDPGPRTGVEQSPDPEKKEEDQTNICKEERTSDPGSGRPEALSPKKEDTEDKGQGKREAGDGELGPDRWAEDVKLEGFGDREEQAKSGEESGQEGEGEEFECYPPGMKVQVRYGRGRNQKTYEATVKECDLEGGEVLYLVHYCGWNIRYDEWIKADKIIRPSNKNAQKVKHRKKIKSKAEREKALLERLSGGGGLSPPRSPRPHRPPRSISPHDLFSSLESKGPESPPGKSLEITSVLNGLRGSESSSDEDTERAEEDEEGDIDEDERAPGEPQGPAEDRSATERRDGIRPSEGARAATSTEEGLTSHNNDGVDCVKRRPEQDPSSERSAKRQRAEGSSKTRARGSTGRADWLSTGSPLRPEDRTAGSREESRLMCSSSSSSSEDEEDEEGGGPCRDGPRSRQRARSKAAASRKYNGLKEKTKGGRPAPAAFWEVPEKRPKLALGEERSPGGRTKGQKDIWCSIQPQWPKKTLKELFSDSDTEAANSPPPPPAAPGSNPEDDPREDDCAIAGGEEDPEASEEKPERERTRREYLSSGSNSVLNTPPTTPDSPPQGPTAAEEAESTLVMPPLTDSAPPTSPPPCGPALPPSGRAESVGGPSETDSGSTVEVEVESLGGELQELHPPEEEEEDEDEEDQPFDGSSSSNSNCSLPLSSKSQQEGDLRDRAVTGLKRQPRDVLQVTSPPKKQKRSPKNIGTHPKKSRKIANSSDSEDQVIVESAGKSSSSKPSITTLKPAGRSPPTGHHKYHKPGDPEASPQHREGHARSPRVYKWSFQMSDLEKMSTLERIAFLQEKLQDIRNHYLSLKSEVASIDRRRKRMKKKERESATAASSSSSSPSSSSLTAAVMLTLAEPVSGSNQNSGVSVECRTQPCVSGPPGEVGVAHRSPGKLVQMPAKLKAHLPPAVKADFEYICSHV